MTLPDDNSLRIPQIQMVSGLPDCVFQTKHPNLGNRTCHGRCWYMYIMAIWYIMRPFGVPILRPFGIFSGYLHRIFFPFWYVAQEKSGNPRMVLVRLHLGMRWWQNAIFADAKPWLSIGFEKYEWNHKGKTPTKSTGSTSTIKHNKLVMEPFEWWAICHLCKKRYIISRVAKWRIFTPKGPIGVTYIGGPWNK
jgi:hypothetical protein